MPEYFTEETVVTDKFLFISYSHEEKAQVHEAVQWMLENGIRLWYDADLHNGDIWVEKARKMLSHENCIGTIFFNSVNAFISDPVAEEREISLQKKLAWEKEDKQFHTLVVNIGKPSTMRLVKQVLDSLPDNDKLIGHAMTTAQLETILKLFPDTRIYAYLEPENPQGFCPAFKEDLKKVAPEVIKEADQAFENIKKRSDGGGVMFKLGKHMVDGKQTPLEWQFLYRNDTECYFLLRQVMDARVGNDLHQWLNTTFKAEAFTPQEQACLKGDIRLLSKQEALEKASGLLSAGCGWWLSDVNGALQKMVRENGGIYDKGSNNIRTSWGVRPVITVDLQTVDQLTNH